MSDVSTELPLQCIFYKKKKIQSKPFADFIHINVYFVTHTHELCLDKCTFTSLVGGKVSRTLSCFHCRQTGGNGACVFLICIIYFHLFLQF